MRRLPLIAITTFLATSLAVGCGGGQSADAESGGGSGGSASSGSGSSGSSGSSGGESGGSGGSEEGGGGGHHGEGGTNEAGSFQLHHSDDADQAHGDHPSEIEATATQAAMRLFVVNPESGPIQGIVIKLTAPDGTAYYTGETDTQGYGEVLVPVGQRYEIEYLALGRRNVSASVNVGPGPNQDIRLTMLYRQRHRPRRTPPPAATSEQPAEPAPEPEGIVLDGVLFDTGRATIQAESFPRLDRVVEYMTYRRSSRIRIAGHTDNVGNPRRNQRLSEQRAQAVRTYLIEHGIDGGRVEAVGYGDQRPVASNDTEEGRHRNRRIEAEEL